MEVFADGGSLAAVVGRRGDGRGDGRGGATNDDGGSANDRQAERSVEAGQTEDGFGGVVGFANEMTG